MTPEEIEQVLREAFPDSDITVTGGGGKFHVQARGDAFAGLMPVRQQQLVYQHLNAYIERGDIHAVTMDLGA